MLKIKAILKEAIAKASEDERDIASRLAQAVLERDHDPALRAASPGDEITRQESALLAKQRTVDILKAALSRLPEATENY